MSVSDTSVAQDAQQHAALTAAAQGAAQAAQQAQSSAAEAKDHAADASTSAKTAAVLASAGNEPSWAYGMVIAFLGISLLALIAGLLINVIRNQTVNAELLSATTLILGGLIGVLAPSPTKR